MQHLMLNVFASDVAKSRKTTLKSFFYSQGPLPTKPSDSWTWALLKTTDNILHAHAHVCISYHTLAPY